ncbi:MAG TPA: hypothetical protein VF194_02435 [Ferrovibrio sp.]|uniref:hypothetical protein n=1 Tax=Ferrovibrio sp. TaxID=1917215 RepID=UPI002ED6683E
MSKKRSETSTYDPGVIWDHLPSGPVLDDKQWGKIAQALWRPKPTKNPIGRRKDGNPWDATVRALLQEQATETAKRNAERQNRARRHTDFAVGNYLAFAALEVGKPSARERRAGLASVIKRTQELRSAILSLDSVSAYEVSKIASSWCPDPGKERSPFDDSRLRGKLFGTARLGQAIRIIRIMEEWCSSALDAVGSDPTNARSKAFDDLVESLMVVHGIHGSGSALFTSNPGSCNAFIAEVCRQAKIPATFDSINHAIRAARKRKAPEVAD